MVIVKEPVAAIKPPRTVVEDLQELGGMAREMAQEKVEQVRAGAAECAKERREKVRHVERSIEQYIREQPLKSMLIAAGVGMVLGRSKPSLFSITGTILTAALLPLLRRRFAPMVEPSASHGPVR